MKQIVDSIDAGDDLAQFIDQNKYSNIVGSSVAGYVDNKFDGNIGDALAFLAVKNTPQAKTITRALVEYSEMKTQMIHKAPRVPSKEDKPDIRRPLVRQPSKLNGYPLFEMLCEKSGVSLKDAECSESYHPVMDVEVEKGLPKHPKNGMRLIIPKDVLSDEVKKSLFDADRAKVEVLRTYKNLVFVRLLRAYKKPEETPQDDESFFAVVSLDPHSNAGIKVVSPSTDKRINIPRKMLALMRKGLSDADGEGVVFRMKPLEEGGDFVFALPVEEIESVPSTYRRAKDVYVDKMNTLKNGGKITL